MGVEYKHYLIPVDNTYKPHPDDLSRLVGALVDRGFVAKADTDTFGKMTIGTYTTDEYAEQTGCFAHLGDRSYRPFPCPCPARDIAALGEQDFKLVWPVESSNESGLKYPLSEFPDWGDADVERLGVPSTPRWRPRHSPSGLRWGCAGQYDRSR